MVCTRKIAEKCMDIIKGFSKLFQIADELLADADVARDIAREAIAKAEKTLEDAYDTLQTLKGTNIV